MGLTAHSSALTRRTAPPKAHDPISLLRDARVGVSTWQARALRCRTRGPAAGGPAADAATSTDAQEASARIVNAFLGAHVRSGLRVRHPPRLHSVRTTAILQFAARAANTLADEYMQMNLEHRLENIDKMIKWVNGEVEKQGQALEQAEAALANYRGTHDAQSLSRQDLMGQRLTSAAGGRADAGARRHAQQKQKFSTDQVQERRRERRHHRRVLPGIGSNAAVVEAKGTLRTAQAQLQDLQRQGFGEAYLPYVTAKTEVANARDKVVAARRTVLESVRQDYQAAVISERQAAGALGQVKGEQAGLDLKAVDYNKLQREADGIHSVYNSLLTQQKELSVVANSRQNNVSLVERAQVPTVPIAPQPRKEWISAILMGVVVAFGLAFGIEYLDDTVKTPDDITRRLRIPLLGLVPAIRGERVPLLSETVPHDFGEAFRSLRTSLVFTSPAAATRIIAVTSTQPLEGKTTTAANLALALALGGARVLVVDADMRRPGLHKSLGVQNNIGLSHLLQGQARVRDAVQRTAEPNLAR